MSCIIGMSWAKNQEWITNRRTSGIDEWIRPEIDVKEGHKGWGIQIWTE